LTGGRVGAAPLGREAARLLLQALNGEIAAAAVRLPVELVVRRSCGCRS
jgi:DNA-binding LacI/PurR family transcriptional regulator